MFVQPGAQEAPQAVQSFAAMFQTAIDTVRETDQQEAELNYLLSVGELDNPALLTMASAKAGAAVDLLVQLRNQALEAYNEVMRISM